MSKPDPDEVVRIAADHEKGEEDDALGLLDILITKPINEREMKA